MLLHEKLLLGGRTLDEWLSDERFNLYQLPKIYTKVLETICITEELALLTRKLSDRDFQIFVSRYGLTQKTYEEISREIGVTRERVRQILERIERIISGEAKFALTDNIMYSSNIALVRIQTALLLGKERGLDITYGNWSNTIKLSGLLGNWEINKESSFDTIEILIAVCKLLEHEGIYELSIPENLRYAIDLATAKSPNLPAKNLEIIKNLPNTIRREIQRHTRFSGCIQARWLSQEIDYEINQTIEIVTALGYNKIKNDWFIPSKVELFDELPHNEVFEHALRKMTYYCGPLNLENICGGLRHAVSRTRYPVPPPDVMEAILKSRSYTCDDNLFYWDGPVDESLSRGEEIILECLNNNGPVVHHTEIAQAFIDSELSFPSMHATLKRTPIIEKVEVGLYKLRGRKVTIEDIDRAKNAGERIPVDLVVSYDKTGKIGIEASLGILPVGTGVFFSENLPNLIGEWKCRISENEFEDVVVTDNEIRKLLKPFEYLQCEIGDRISFSFNTWTRTVTIEKVQNEKN